MDDEGVGEVKAFVLHLVFVDFYGQNALFHDLLVHDVLGYFIHDVHYLSPYFLREFALEVMNNVK